MAQYESSRQIYEELVEKADVHWLLGLLAFGIVEEQRIEWEKHFEQREGHSPAAEEIRSWYRDLPAPQLLRARGDAENALRVYASGVWNEFSASERDEVRNGVVVEEIRLSRRFWPQFGVGVASGIVSSFVFALLLIALLWIIEKDPSPIALGRDFVPSPSSKAPQP